ncbi:hypothetical protein [Ureibacillus sinduriensis]|uniref:Uncharacterized protein n=1 Tax=Ureibacillus sinduriensis BLB-1 = JCM 15800 TaxID=1384057 RepID=A0A0A3HPS3_9BACL|nr:hypothetical protein [Ureibacillus sinduriensis]KGR74374.1 hypothetical protein CD33_14805 [Ureibacillus sinduriensis BLB-1 = JCM 15800]
MGILNSDYAFLEADYSNSSLSRLQLKVGSNRVQSTGQSVDEGNSLKNMLIGLLIKVNPVAPILAWIPADIYCIVFLMTGELLTF